MKTKLMTLFRLLSILALLPLVVACSPSAGSALPKNEVPREIERTARRLTDDLKEQGFEVARGYFVVYEEEDCEYTQRAMGTCYFNNPAAPYVFPIVPTWPEEFVDPATKDVFGPTEPGYSATWRLDPREAIVILAKMPPPAKYFGLQTYLFTRQGSFDTGSDAYQYFADFGFSFVDQWFHAVPGNPDRIGAANSQSNPINNVIIAQQSGAAFDQLRYFIITPDQSMDQAVREALAKISIPEKDIFTEPIGSELRAGLEVSAMRTGLDEAADDFMTWIRFALPEDETDGEDWRTRLPMVVLRMRPTRPDWQPVPYEPFTDPETRSGVDEWGYLDDRNDLVDQVRKRWHRPLARTQEFLILQMPPANEIGPRCTEVGMDCLADNQDATYQASYYPTILDPFPRLLEKGEVYAVVGTLGTQTGNATYVGLGINNPKLSLGLENIRDDQLKNTAQAYAGEVGNTDKFYLYYFARSCEGLEDLTDPNPNDPNGLKRNCFEITEEMIPVCQDYRNFAEDPSCVFFEFSVRNYIFPGTRRGPASELILPSVLIKLREP